MQAGRDLRFPRRFELSNGADLIEPQPPRSPDPRSYAATAFGHMAVLSRNRTDDFNLHSWPTDGSSTVSVVHQINVEYRVLLLRVECGKGLETPHY
jgi:hypothetical protein